MLVETRASGLAKLFCKRQPLITQEEPSAVMCICAILAALRAAAVRECFLVEGACRSKLHSLDGACC